MLSASFRYGRYGNVWDGQLLPSSSVEGMRCTFPCSFHILHYWCIVECEMNTEMYTPESVFLYPSKWATWLRGWLSCEINDQGFVHPILLTTTRIFGIVCVIPDFTPVSLWQLWDDTEIAVRARPRANMTTHALATGHCHLQLHFEIILQLISNFAETITL